MKLRSAEKPRDPSDQLFKLFNKHMEAFSNIQSAIPYTTTSVHTMKPKKEVIITFSKAKLITSGQKLSSSS